jgi:hypothetical protein
LTGCQGKEEKSEDETTLIQNEKQEYSDEENESTEETSIAVVQETTEENTEENDFIQEETSEIETDVNTKAIHEEYLDINQYGTYTSSEKDFEDENGKSIYHYIVYQYYLNDSKYQKVNETLKDIYNKKELEYQEYGEGERLLWIDYIDYEETIWYLHELTYVGEDYVSFLFNQEWTQAIAILPYYTTVTIDVQTGEIVDLEDILGCTWSELSQELFGSGELNSDDYAFYLFGEDVHFIYRTNYWVDEIVVRRETEDQEDTNPRRYSIIDKNR